MKLWKKIYIIFFICFIISFNLAGVAIIERIYNKSINREVKESLDEHKNIVSEIDISIHMFNRIRSIDHSSSSKSIQDLIKEYVNTFRTGGEYIEILDMKNEEIFSNLDFKPPKYREELKALSRNERKYIIRTIDDKNYLFVTGIMDLGEDYKISYIKDVSYIYQERKDQYRFFFIFEFYICMIFAVLIYFVSNMLTKPVNRLIRTTQKISDGDYCDRVKITSKDELGTLSSNFNKMAQEIEEKINELEKNNAAKKMFIENLTHELKTPLTSIIGYADLLRTRKVKDKILWDSVDFIYSEGKRLEKLSFKMMDLILLRADDFELKSEKIINLFEEVKKGLKPKLKDKNIELIISGQNDEVTLEKDLMKILLTNLIDNSIKACEKNSKIQLSYYENCDKRIIEVADNGIGISKENIDRILEPFYVVDKSRTRANNGAGLGLAICKRIVEIHGGRLKIESRENEGTKVKIIFQ